VRCTDCTGARPSLIKLGLQRKRLDASSSREADEQFLMGQSRYFIEEFYTLILYIELQRLHFQLTI